MSKKEINKKEIKDKLIVKIKEIELENMESSEDNENKEVRGKIVDKILAELEKAVTNNEN